MRKPPEKKPPLTVEELARFLGCPFEGSGKAEIRGVSSLEKAREGDLVFLSQRKYRKLLDDCQASVAIIPTDEKYERLPVIKSDNPHLSFIKVVEVFHTPYCPEPGIHSTAVVSPSAKVGENVSIGAFAYVFPFVVIYPRVKIGKESVIHSHVSIREEVQIGNRVTIHNNSVIGSDGFGYIQDKDGKNIKIPHVGTVIIEDDVEVGANTAIDRAALGETLIKKGAKIDNLVQIAHSVEVGPGSILAGQTGISGSVKIGKNVIMGGQVGVADHLKIGDKAVLAAKTGVIGDIPSNSVVAGYPHQDIREWRKSSLMLSKLYDLFKEVKRLNKKVEELETKVK